MDDKLPLISYAFAAMSGICFIGGLIILSSEGRVPVCTDSKKSYPCWTKHLTQNVSDTWQEVS